MENFFAGLSRWPAGQEQYHWHLLPDPDLTRDRLCVPYEGLTHRSGLEPVAPRWCHVTVLQIAPVEEVTDADLGRMVGEVTDRCAHIAGFDLLVDRPEIGRTAVVCPARPGSAARKLWSATAEVTRAVTGGRWPLGPEIYYPHLALAYAVGALDHRPLKAWMSDCDREPVRLPVDRLSLVAQSHDGRRITWRHLRDVPLRPARA